MSEEIEQFLKNVDAIYRPLLAGYGERLEGQTKLWNGYSRAVEAYRRYGNTYFRGVYERINELVVASVLLTEEDLLDSRISYEPKINQQDRRIDFVCSKCDGSAFYVEVKTIHPSSSDDEKNWEKFQRQKKFITENVDLVFGNEWLGARLSQYQISARTKFLDRTIEFEERLSQAYKSHPGRGMLVFCGTGKEWHQSALEDFADFYLTGMHRPDDPFANMEAFDLRQRHIQLLRNISAFGFMRRSIDSLKAENWTPNVRGPHIPT